ncbi:MAG TPA: hypothetical protein VIY73_00065 [Polyangiaceae bacterium]
MGRAAVARALLVWGAVGALAALASLAGCSRSCGAEPPPSAGAHDAEPRPPSPSGPGASEQSVMVAAPVAPGGLDRVHAAEGALREAIAHADVGRFDGDEVTPDGHEVTLYAYGPDADLLWAAMAPVLAREPSMRGAAVTIRYGIWHEGMRETHLVVGGDR